MTADKSPPLPDSVGQIVADICAFADAAPPYENEMREWATRLAALTDAGDKPAAPSGADGDWETVRAHGFDSLIDAMERADRRGYMPDALREAWDGFDFERSTHPAPRPSAALVKLIRQLQWGFNHRRCPICAGWDPKGNGETDYRHTDDCPVAAALSAVSATPAPESK